MFAVKSYTQGVQRLVAACDAGLLGTEHREGRFHLQVPASFYDGLRVDEEALAMHLRGATVANLVGPATVAVAVELGLVAQEHVLTVDGVPHAQFMVMGQ